MLTINNVTEKKIEKISIFNSSINDCAVKLCFSSAKTSNFLWWKFEDWKKEMWHYNLSDDRLEKLRDMASKHNRKRYPAQMRDVEKSTSN